MHVIKCSSSYTVRAGPAGATSAIFGSSGGVFIGAVDKSAAGASHTSQRQFGTFVSQWSRFASVPRIAPQRLQPRLSILNPDPLLRGELTRLVCTLRRSRCARVGPPQQPQLRRSGSAPADYPAVHK